jgi:hypothetical protein
MTDNSDVPQYVDIRAIYEFQRKGAKSQRMAKHFAEERKAFLCAFALNHFA